MAITDYEMAPSLPFLVLEIDYNSLEAQLPAPCDQPSASKHNIVLACAIYKAPESLEPPPPFVVKPIDGKGLGMVATTSLSRGDRVLVEAPVLHGPRNKSGSWGYRQLETLDKATKDEVFTLVNFKTSGRKLKGIIYTNAISLRGTDDHVGLFLTASRINHACVPNTNNAWDPETGKLTVIATRPIAAGEEITATYIKGFGVREDRRRHLWQGFGFWCDCATCTCEDMEMSDLRNAEILEILKIPDKEAKWNTHKMKLLNVLQLLKFYESEGIVDYNVPEARALAHKLAVRQADQYKQWWFADKAAIEYGVVDGEDSATAREWREIAREARKVVDKHPEWEEVSPEEVKSVGGFDRWIHLDRKPKESLWDKIEVQAEAWN